MRNGETKRETSVGKIGSPVARTQLNVLPVAGQCTSKVLLQPSTSAHVSREEDTCPRRKTGSRGGNATFYVPVVSSSGKALMPCHPARARKLVRSGRALRRFSKGLFCIHLCDRADGATQPVACGIDPGSKKEGLTVKSASHTFLNIQADAVTWVRDAVEVRRIMRRSRRNRKTPCRQPRANRARGCLSPSTRSRWGWKLRLARWLSALYPISCFVVEDIKAVTKGKRRWDSSFSPLQVGKNWFYGELRNVSRVETKEGWETKDLRDEVGLVKTRRKMTEVFAAHCVDSWVLANWWVGGHATPDNTRLLCVTPLHWHRRKLHMMQPSKGGLRKRDGGTRSMGFKRGSMVRHPRHGVVYVGGTKAGRISLHSFVDGKRLSQNAKPSECRFLGCSSWRMRMIHGQTPVNYSLRAEVDAALEVDE